MSRHLFGGIMRCIFQTTLRELKSMAPHTASYHVISRLEPALALRGHHLECLIQLLLLSLGGVTLDEHWTHHGLTMDSPWTHHGPVDQPPRSRTILWQALILEPEASHVGTSAVVKKLRILPHLGAIVRPARASGQPEKHRYAQIFQVISSLSTGLGLVLKH